MSSEHILIGFSPCPNDCFIFDAMVHGRIDTRGIRYEPVMEDVETLNRMAAEGKLPVTKLSYHAFSYMAGTYQLLDSGSALGNNCGPLLITASDPALIRRRIEEGEKLRIAIPGRLTTANFLLGFAFPGNHERVELVFSEIEDAVLSGNCDAGVIIHENRFTYALKGLKLVQDLGAHWEESTGNPIPLGGIVVRRDVPLQLQRMIEGHIRESVKHAFAHPADSSPFVKLNAQEMDEEVMQKHIALYVNHYSVSLGSKGRQAAKDFLLAAGVTRDDIFVTPLAEIPEGH